MYRLIASGWIFGVCGITPAVSFAQCPLLYTFDGEAAGDLLGIAISFAGDIDDDGCDDVLLGAPGYDVPGGAVSRGKVYLYSGATGNLIRTWVGDGGVFGARLAGGGDIDGDSVPDVIVAAYGYSTPLARGAGRVYAFSGVTGATLWTWDGAQTGDRYGWSVAGPGDLDGDGHADVLIGQPGRDGPIAFAGKVYAYSGRTGQELWSRTGDHPGDHFGWAVSGAGDFNGDGVRDVIAGAFSAAPSYVHLLHGLGGAPLKRIQHWQTGDGAFGSAVSGVGDVNGDGFSDVIVGAYTAGGESYLYDNGQAYVFLGPEAVPLWTFEGDPPSDFLGYSVGGGGDVDGDGFDDLVVGAYGHWGPAGYGSGKAYVYSGATGSVIQSWDGENSWDFFGQAVAGGGDADGDGLSDVLLGVRDHDSIGPEGGRAYLYTPAIAGPCTCFGWIDYRDHRDLVDCMGASGTGDDMPNDCACSDFTGDGKIDLADFGSLQSEFWGRR